jgi:hypothetical protein
MQILKPRKIQGLKAGDLQALWVNWIQQLYSLPTSRIDSSCASRSNNELKLPRVVGLSLPGVT